MNSNRKGPAASSSAAGEGQILKMFAEAACAKNLFLQVFVCVCMHDPCVWPV